MRHIRLFVIIGALLLNFSHIRGQEDIEGLYHDEFSINKLIIHGDTLSLVYPFLPQDWQFLDTTAHCKLTHCEDSFYEVNSMEWRLKKTVSYSYTQSCQDSIIVKLVSHAYFMEYDIKVSVCETSYEFRMANGHGECIIPLNSAPKEVYITVRPPHLWLNCDLFDNLCRSALRESFFVDLSPLNELQNTVTIDLTNLDDKYFQRHLVEGEYLRIVSDTIFWRGRPWVRENVVDEKKN